MTDHPFQTRVRFGIWSDSPVAADELQWRLNERGQQAVIAGAGNGALMECLVVLIRNRLAGSEMALLIRLANRARLTVAVEVPADDADASPPWPRDATLLWGGQVNDLSDVASDLTSLVRPTGLAFSSLPALLKVDPGVLPGEVVDQRQGLVERLADAIAPRVIAVSPSLWDELTTPHRAVDRADYDLMRLASWTAHERSHAFINMRLARPEDLTVSLTGPMSLDDVMADPLTRPLVMLLGEPSSGKSLQLRYYDANAALRSLRRQPAAPASFYVALAEQPARPDISLDWLRRQWAAAVDVARWCDFDQFLDDGGVVLLDGLNEGGVRGLELEQWMWQWRDVIHQLFDRRASKVVASCRTRDQVIRMRAPRDQHPTAVTILPLSREEILAIATERNVEMARRLARAFDEDPGLIELYASPFRLKTYLDSGTLWVARTASRLFGVELSAAMLREWDHDNPHGRLIPGVQANSLQTAAWRNEDPWQVLETIPLIQGLGQLAKELSMPALADGRARLTMSPGDAGAFLARAITAIDGQPVAPQEALETAKDLNCLVADKGKIRFTHPSVLHLFAAVGSSVDDIVALAEQELRRQSGEPATDAGFPPVAAPPNYTQHRYDELFQFAAQLRGTEVPDRLLAVDPVLAARVLLATRRDPDDPVGRRIVTQLRRKLDTSTVPAVRAGILAALGDLGWSLPLARADGRGATMLVPAQVWHLGRRGVAGQTQLAVSSEVRAIELPQFRISRFPVSNAEYASFIDGHGYEDQSLWSPEGWEWRIRRRTVEQFVADWQRRQVRLLRDHPAKTLRLLRDGVATAAGAAALIRFATMPESEIVEYARALQARPVTAPRYWSKRPLRNRLQPVVGVSWFEANAFCQWLGRQLNAAVRLPSENEWEAACLHSWGVSRTEDIDAVLSPPYGNTGDLGWPATSPIGTFAAAAQVRRNLAVELLGNAFKWIFDYYVAGDHSRRSVKGGSWRHEGWRAHPSYRGRGDVDAQNDDIGFRYVIAEGPT